MRSSAGQMLFPTGHPCNWGGHTSANTPAASRFTAAFSVIISAAILLWVLGGWSRRARPWHMYLMQPYRDIAVRSNNSPYNSDGLHQNEAELTSDRWNSYAEPNKNAGQVQAVERWVSTGFVARKTSRVEVCAGSRLLRLPSVSTCPLTQNLCYHSALWEEDVGEEASSSCDKQNAKRGLGWQNSSHPVKVMTPPYWLLCANFLLLEDLLVSDLPSAGTRPVLFKGFRPTMATPFWMCLWRYLQEGVTERFNSECGWHHPCSGSSE